MNPETDLTMRDYIECPANIPDGLPEDSVLLVYSDETDGPRTRWKLYGSAVDVAGYAGRDGYRLQPDEAGNYIVQEHQTTQNDDVYVELRHELRPGSWVERFEPGLAAPITFPVGSRFSVKAVAQG